MTNITLYPANETAFASQGLGDLSAEATRAEVVRQLNGIFEISIDYPQSGKLFEELQTGQIVLAQAEQNKAPQVFEITEIEQSNGGMGITLKGAQIALTRLKYFLVSPFTAQSNTEAIAEINTNITDQAGIFEITADFAASGVFTLDKPKTAATVTFSAILEQYGGELDFDGFEVKQLATLGTARGVVIRYGGNLSAYTLRRTVGDSYNYVLGYYLDSGGGVTYGDFVSVASVLPNVPVIDDADRALYLNLSSLFSTTPTKAEITAKTREVITQNANAETWRYKSAADVEYLDLAQTANYKNIITAGDVIQLGDVITLIITNQDKNAKFGYYEAQKRVIGTTWDILAERYTSLELADPEGQGLTYEEEPGGAVTAVTETSILGNNSNGTALTGSDILARIGTTETPEPESGGGGACEKIVGMIPINYNDNGTERTVAQFGTKGISGANRGVFLDSQYYPITETLGPAVPGVDLSSPSKKTVYSWTDSNNVTHSTTVTTNAASSESGTDYFARITGADRLYYFSPSCSFASLLFNTVGFSFDIQAGEIIAVGMRTLRPLSTASPLLGTASNPWTLYGTVNTLSDGRKKKDIKPMGDAFGDLLESLRPVLFKYKDGDGATRAGLIAQEVQEAQKRTKTEELTLVREEEETGALSVDYIELIPILINEVNRLRDEIEKIKREA